MKCGEKLPESWTVTHFSPFYKNKGDRRKLSNHRGIFIAFIISKMFEKFILYRIKENLHISEFQSGHSAIENSLDTKSLASYFKAERKTLLMSLYDFKTCFDSLWLGNTLIDLFFNGIDNECLNLLSEMHT